MIKIEYNGFKRISKAMARKLFNNGTPVYILPCKVKLDNAWIQPAIARKDNYYSEDFDMIINAFEFYSCQYNELGKYASYYLKEEN